MSKDLKPKIRIGQTAGSRRRRVISWIVVLLACGGGVFAAYRYAGTTTVEVPVTRVRLSEFIISVKTRGEIRSTRSVILSAPQVPSPRIVRLAESGKPIKKGEVVIEFDTAQQEQSYIEGTTNVRAADADIVKLKASQQMIDEMDGMNLMTSEYNLQRAKLEASKAEILSEIEGAKNKIDVGISEGELGQVKITIKSHDVTQQADLERLTQRKDKTLRDLERYKTYLSKMVVRAPNDGIVNLLPNFRSQGSWGSTPPPFKEGDNAWTGASIAEIPDLSEMRIELKLEEVDRGKIKLGQQIRMRVDAVPDKEFTADLDWISPIAALQYRGMGMSEKSFPARATLKSLDPRLRPGMSATAEIIIESVPKALLVPVRASFMRAGKPAVWVQKGQEFEVRQLEVGKRNDTDMSVLKGLKEGEIVAMENPAEAAKRAKKL